MTRDRLLSHEVHVDRSLPLIPIDLRPLSTTFLPIELWTK